MIRGFIDFLRSLIPRIKRSQLKGESLTDDEYKLMRGTCACPDCGGDLLQGPIGGASMNVACSRCSSRYNISLHGFFDHAERISDSSLIEGLTPQERGICPLNRCIPDEGGSCYECSTECEAPPWPPAPAGSLSATTSAGGELALSSGGELSKTED